MSCRSGDESGFANREPQEVEPMPDLEVTNWFGDVVSHPKVIVDANSVADIVAVMKDAVKYPSPVRAVGSNHSTSPCGVADGGTLIRMKMNRILSIGPDTMTRRGGRASHRHGSRAREAATCSFTSTPRSAASRRGAPPVPALRTLRSRASTAGWGSYVIGVKLVLPYGDRIEVTESPDRAIAKGAVELRPLRDRL